jgi:hypothetical protein
MDEELNYLLDIPAFRQWLCLVGNILTGFTCQEKGN